MIRSLLVATVLASLALAACDDKPANPAAPAAPGTPMPTPAAAPATNPAAPAQPAAAAAAPAAANPGAGITALVGTWVIDIDASHKAMIDASKVSILQGGMQYTEEQLVQAVDLAIDGLKRADISCEFKADSTYITKTNAVVRPITGTVAFANGEYTLIPDDQSVVVRYKLVNGRLVNQRPRDPAAQFVALVWKKN